MESLTYRVDPDSHPHALDYTSWFLWPASLSFQVYPGNVLNTYVWQAVDHRTTRVIRQWFAADGVEPELIESLAEQDLHTTVAEDVRLVESARRRLWTRGGFPRSFLAPTDADSAVWREQFIRTYLERDIPALGPRIPAQTLRRFWTMLAHSQGGLWNAASLARSLAVDGKTVARYVDLLADLLLVRRLPPLHVNVRKRLAKAPKIYVRDSGIVHALLRLDDLDSVLGHPIAGASWEGFVIETLLRAAPERTEASFYRTASGVEIDLVLELPGGRVWAVEIKRGFAPAVTRGFRVAIEDIQPDRAFIVHGGEDRYPKGDGVEAVGLRELADELAG